jgi:DNA-binding NtrC family response regulator
MARPLLSRGVHERGGLTMFGWSGTILRVNLSNGTTSTEPTTRSLTAEELSVACDRDEADMTGPWEPQLRQALVAVKVIARAIEGRLRAVMGVREEVVRYAFREARGGGEALVAVDSRGRVLAANDAASRSRLVSGSLLRAGLGEAIADGFRSQPGGDFRIELPEGRPLVVVPVRYETATVGAILRASVASARRRPAARPTARHGFEVILGESPSMRRAIELARTAARNDLPVVVSGESGTGKELFAHAIHGASHRGEASFVAVNCGAIPEQLVEAELFGYEAGTLTGVRQGGGAGRFEDANGGTLFLDEVSELPLQAQTALLRVLQEKEVVRLGSNTPRPVDVRVVAATDRPLDDEVRAGRFRRDLYYWLNVLTILLPPLRVRGDDVGLLARVILERAEEEVGRPGLSLTYDALPALTAHPWPGNVRELRNVILRAAATAPGAAIRAEDLLLEQVAVAPCPPAPRPGRAGTTAQTLDEAAMGAEQELLLAKLDECGWNFAASAQQLGVSRMTFYRRLQKWGISRSSRR